MRTWHYRIQSLVTALCLALMWFELNPAVDKNAKVFFGTYDNMSIVFVVTAFLLAILLMIVGHGLEWFIEVCGPVIAAVVLGIQGAAAVANGLWVTAVIVTIIAGVSCGYLLKEEQTDALPAERWLFSMTIFGLAWITVHDSVGTFDVLSLAGQLTDLIMTALLIGWAITLDYRLHIKTLKQPA